MLSPFHKKAPEHHRVRPRTISDNDSEGVICASENKSKGVSFSFSGPAGSLHAAEAIAIAGSVYSNKKSSGRKKSTVVKRIPAPSENVDDEAGEIVQGGNDEKSEIRRSRTHASTRTTTSSRHAAPSALASSSSRSAARSKASTKVTTNRHSSSGRTKAFKHESESQLTYGVWDEGRRLLVSAPKDSQEADLFRQVEELAR